MKGVLTLLFVFFVSVVAIAQTQVSIVASKDNTMYSEGGNLSNGVGIYLFAGKTGGGVTRRALVKFDLTNIPSGATITDAKIKLNLSKAATSDNQTITVHKVNAEWSEGTSDASSNEGKGAPATSGDATWTHRIFSSNQWSAEGGDFSSTISTSLSIGAPGSIQFASTAQTIADVQGWLNNPSTNFGWLIKGNEGANSTAKRFDSREHGTPANRPTLIVTYTTSTSVEENAIQPYQFELGQNYPNPFNPTTTIRYEVSASNTVSLKVFDLLGNEVAQLVNGVKSAGKYSVEFNGEKLSSGIYYYRLQSGNNIATKKLMLLK